MVRVMHLAGVAIAILLCTAPATIVAAGGTVQGQVVNGTTGATAVPSGLSVRLYLFSGNTLKETRTTSTNAQGLFRFEGVPTGSTWSAVAAVEYAGVEYASDALDLSQGADFNGNITVYETTTADTALHVEQCYLIIERGPGQLGVTEVVILTNGGDRTFIGGDQEIIPQRRATAQLPLPAGATDVSFPPEEDAEAMVRTGKGLVDTRPIVPGRKIYRISYALPYKGPTYSLLKPLAYPTISLNVLVDTPGEVSAPMLQELGKSEAPGRAYQHLGGRSLEKNTDILIRFSKLDQKTTAPHEIGESRSAPDPVAHLPVWIDAMPLLALGVLLPALLISLQKGRSTLQAMPGAMSVQARGAQQEWLLNNIAGLDERYEAGDLDEAIYRKEREASKSLLIGLIYGLRGEESGAKCAKRAQASRSRKSAGGKAIRVSDRPRQRRSRPGDRKPA